MQMQESYNQYNQAARASGKSRGHFLVDLTRPGHLTACLRNFQEAIGCSDDNWDSSFCMLVPHPGDSDQKVSVLAAVTSLQWTTCIGCART